MTLGRSPLPQSEPTPEYWQLLYKQADFRTQQLVAGERSSSVPDEADEADEADEDQTGTNRLELCFALPTQISPVRRWDKLSLRKLNPRQAAAIDHYTSHPQIFVAICNFEIGVIIFFLFCNICTLRSPVFSCQ